MTQNTHCHDDRGILARPDGASIAYHRIICPNPDKNAPTVIFLHGLMSDMNGDKAVELSHDAAENNYNFVRFDMFGHGQSSGAFTDGTIGRWCDDTIAVINKLTEGPVILVGSSMGGWVMLRVAMQFTQENDPRIKGLIGIAPAPDFTEEDMWASMNEQEKATLLHTGLVTLHDDTGYTYTVSKSLILDGRKNLLFTGPIAFDGPVRILQGMQDQSVPWKNALRITKGLTTSDVTVDLIKDGDHRLSRPQDLCRLTHTVKDLIKQIKTPLPVGKTST